MTPLPTVKIKHKLTKSGYVIINERDFDKSKHELFVEPEKKPRQKKAASKAKTKETAD